MRVLRSNKDSLMAMLEAFVYDPLISWRLLVLPQFEFGRIDNPETDIHDSIAEVDTPSEMIRVANDSDEGAQLLDDSDNHNKDIASGVPKSVAIAASMAATMDPRRRQSVVGPLPTFSDPDNPSEENPAVVQEDNLNARYAL